MQGLVPVENNGHFDSKVVELTACRDLGGRCIPSVSLSRCYADRSYRSSPKTWNGTFINGERLSPEGLESERYELKSDNIVVSP